MIKGIKIPSNNENNPPSSPNTQTLTSIEKKLDQFVDDLNLFLIFDHITLQETITVLSQLENSTGLNVNYDKSSIYRIGSLTQQN